MDTRALLERLLASSQDATRKGLDLAEQKLGVPGEGENRTAMLDGMGKGALAAGAVALLLGTKSGRKLTGSAVKVGGLAAVGGLAYSAYQQWQANQNSEAPKPTGVPDASIGTPIAELESSAADRRSESLIRAMISAARADGHIDDAERTAITGQIKILGLEQEMTDFLLAELGKPLDAAGIAAAADSPEAAAEIYLASVMVIDVDDPKERAYLDELAGHLKLAPELSRQLEQQVAI